MKVLRDEAHKSGLATHVKLITSPVAGAAFSTASSAAGAGTASSNDAGAVFCSSSNGAGVAVLLSCLISHVAWIVAEKEASMQVLKQEREQARAQLIDTKNQMKEIAKKQTSKLPVCAQGTTYGSIMQLAQEFHDDLTALKRQIKQEVAHSTLRALTFPILG